MISNGKPLTDDMTVEPNVGNLFSSNEFWYLLGSVRKEPVTCLTAVGALADFVQEHGFEGFAAHLRTNPNAALPLLPKETDRPKAKPRT
jgi:hypothetical protein